ncbi:MAG: phosphonate C-P lyase system protein PhnH [Chloroflexi bacterium]|nr:phosphonate C-P lyase system protein PhnH [Chloroflexota bacterium]
MSFPAYTPAEAERRETFLALMNAFSYPGRTYELPLPADAAFADGAQAIADALLDLETSYHTPDTDLVAKLAQTSARALPVARATYHFYPTIDDAALADIREAHVGTMLYPDQAATLIIGCQLNAGNPLRWTGPGINGERRISIDGLPEAFWSLRQTAIRYPLGWDVVLLAGQIVVGLPRSTRIDL